jgi:hypothetical protein
MADEASMERDDARAVLVTGVYGSGKTSAVEEIADVLEERGVQYAALDLDWLGWFDPGIPNDDHEAGWPVKLKNVDAVVGNYYDAGVRRFALAGSIGTSGKLSQLGAALGMSMTVVRLTVPIEEIERRLSSYLTAGREDDLAVARRWAAEGWGEGIGDFVFENDRPIRDVASEILDALGW